MKLTDDNILQANINRTKQYVRDNGGKVSTLPTATSSNVGQIYQYTGSTTLTYTHGYFYECKENNGTYSWVNVPVSEGSGGGHTILNGSGSAMNQRGKLQFDGLNVTDDSVNDKTVVTAPTPDYVDEQFNSSKTYSKGMTCIEGNVRYRYKNSTASSGHRPPNTTYWEVYSVSDELKQTETLLWSQTGVTATTDYNNININIKNYNKLRIRMFSTTSLYNGEKTQLTERVFTISDIQSYIGSNYYFDISEYFEKPDSCMYTFYLSKTNTTLIVKSTIWRWGTGSDRSIDLYLYGIK